MSKKNKDQSPQARPPATSRNKPYVAGVVLVVALVAVYLVGTNIQTDKLQTASIPSTKAQTRSAVAFVKEGELRFLDSRDNLRSAIDIEIADDDASRMQGLMYRDSMAETQGMIFVFPDEAERSFWMENTILPLDIVYINAQNRIITIQKNTVPYSRDSIPSNGPAKYVVEVNAGYCDRHSVRVGDHIEWKRL
ncbi:MAG TPA: DUF192 domain-containing protein [Bacteroidota bacterium]|nr:DUF192 domain-containing protein [Bacteroidota bacterium]